MEGATSVTIAGDDQSKAKRGRPISRRGPNYEAKPNNLDPTPLQLTPSILWIPTTVIEVRQTEIFARWLANLRDGRARARINARIRRLSVGNPGDAKSVGGGVSEMRIDYGPGYRVYFICRGEALVILVASGDKRTQNHDIAMAIKLARDL